MRLAVLALRSRALRALLIVLPLVALAAGPAYALDAADARHLLGRTGFGATLDEAAALAPLSRQQAVDRILDGARREASTPGPAWLAAKEPAFPVLTGLDADTRKALQDKTNVRAQELKAWWYDEMLATPSPITERMTLFWHNHFTSSLRKSRSPVLHYRQNALLRREGLGNFGTMLREISRDPVMLDYLDNRLNRWERPNENFARELLELFTLGEGHYSEKDIKEAARAFTGWTTDRDRERFVDNVRIHDPDSKTFLGRTGRFDGDDILKILLQQPRTAEFVTEKLWREFVSPTPDGKDVKRLAAVFRDGNYEIKPLMRALLTSDAFWAVKNRGELIKSPVEFLVGTVRFFKETPADGDALARYSRRLGQDVFDPPNVKGWPGHTAWISTDSLLAREQFLQRLLRGDRLGPNQNQASQAGMGMAGNQRRPPTLPAATDEGKGGAKGAALEAEMATLLLAKPPVNPAAADAPERARIAAIFLDPVYQLK
ncbi:MAG: DUF1800 family protein [Alphaproteobacteria bacterium]